MLTKEASILHLPVCKIAFMSDCTANPYSTGLRNMKIKALFHSNLFVKKMKQSTMHKHLKNLLSNLIEGSGFNFVVYVLLFVE